MKNKNELVETNPQGLSLFGNEQFEIAEFKQLIAEKDENSKRILEDVKEIYKESKKKAKTNKTKLSDPEQDFKLVVKMNDEMKQAYKDGDIKLRQFKDGRVVAQLMGEKGIGQFLPIEEELANKDISSDDLTAALQMQAIEEKLQEITSSLEEIGENVISVIKGQQNDRVGLYYSGLNMFREARTIKNPELKKLLIAQSIKTISDSNAQMIEEIKDNIAYIVNKEYLNTKGKYTQRIDEKITDINKNFQLIYRSYILKAGIYFDNNEIEATLTTFKEYGSFLENVIVPYAPKLSEHDKLDIYLENGIWESRANALIGVKELALQIENKNTYYIEMENIDG